MKKTEVKSFIEALQAFVDGKKVQYSLKEGEWKNVKWSTEKAIYFHENMKYRIIEN